MKTNISLALNGILLLAVVFLFYLHYSARVPDSSLVKTSASTSEDTSAKKGLDSLQPGLVASSTHSMGSTIVFVNTDTLLEKYEYFKKNKQRLESRSRQLEQELASRAKDLEQELAAAQQKVQAGLIPPAQAKTLEQALMAKQQALYEYRESRGRVLLEEEKKFNEELNNRIRNFLKKQADKKGYTYVMGYTNGGSILFANDSLDITRPTLNGLNKLFKAK